jgi:hypothetical protein
MKRSVAAVVFAVVSLSIPSFAQKKSCDELKMDIAAQLDGKGVRKYTLAIVELKDVKDSDKVVGSCDGGTKRITYTRE